MRRLFLLLFCISSIQPKAQPPTRNNVFLELGGAAFFYSINYERLFLKKENTNIAGRIGFTYFNFFNQSKRKISGVPVGISFLKRLRSNFLEIGVSNAFLKDSTEPELAPPGGRVLGTSQEFVMISSFRLGIRHQPAKSGFFWNILGQFSVIFVSDNPEMKKPDEVSSTPFLSLGVGYSF